MRTPLLLAVEENKIEMVTLLTKWNDGLHRERKELPDAKMLNTAAEKNHVGIVKYLVEHYIIQASKNEHQR